MDDIRCEYDKISQMVRGYIVYRTVGCMFMAVSSLVYSLRQSKGTVPYSTYFHVSSFNTESCSTMKLAVLAGIHTHGMLSNNFREGGHLFLAPVLNGRLASCRRDTEILVRSESIYGHA